MSVQKCHCSIFFFFGNIDQENVFYDIVQRKIAFLCYKNIRFKKSKMDIFPKGLTHGFGRKIAIFPTSFFQAIKARKMSFMIFQNEKTPFWVIKARSSKSRKIDIFLKVLTHGFGPKMAIFPTFLFQAIQPRQMSFMIFQKKKTPFQAIKTRSSRSRKIDIFPNRFTRDFGIKMAIFPPFFLGNIGQENVFYHILH